MLVVEAVLSRERREGGGGGGGEGDEGGDTDERDVGEAGAVVIDVGVEGPEPCMAGWAEEAGAMLGWPAGGTTPVGAGRPSREENRDRPETEWFEWWRKERCVRQKRHVAR